MKAIAKISTFMPVTECAFCDRHFRKCTTSSQRGILRTSTLLTRTRLMRRSRLRTGSGYRLLDLTWTRFVRCHIILLKSRIQTLCSYRWIHPNSCILFLQ
jgi:hypothetical protein